MTPSSPKRFDEPIHRDPFSRHHRMSRGSADHQDNAYHIRDDGTPDSPISQVRLMVFFHIFFFFSSPALFDEPIEIPSIFFTISLSVSPSPPETSIFSLSLSLSF